MNFRNGQREMCAVDPATCGRLQIAARSAAPCRQPHAVDAVADGVDVVNFRLAHRGDAGLQFRLTGAATEIICFKLLSPESLRVVEKLGMDRQRVATLPLGSFIARNQLSGGLLAGRVF